MCRRLKKDMPWYLSKVGMKLYTVLMIDEHVETFIRKIMVSAIDSADKSVIKTLMLEV